MEIKCASSDLIGVEAASVHDFLSKHLACCAQTSQTFFMNSDVCAAQLAKEKPLKRTRLQNKVVKATRTLRHQPQYGHVRSDKPIRLDVTWAKAYGFMIACDCMVVLSCLFYPSLFVSIYFLVQLCHHIFLPL